MPHVLSPLDAAQRYLTALESLQRFLAQLTVPEMAMEELLYAQALVRNYLLRCLSHQASDFRHIAVIGGGGAGKSTVVNILLGEKLAETNPQAGYTRHPTAFCKNIPDSLDFLPTLRAVPCYVAGDVDEDLYDVRLRNNNDLPADVVLWDNPDVTTIHSAHYTHRLIEVLGLADAVIYVASAQRYNDRIPSQYLAMLAQSGKPVIACLTKVPEADEPTITKHFIEEVLHSLLKNNSIPCTVIPYKPLEELTHDETMRPHRQKLLDALKDWLASGSACKQATGQRILSYLEHLETRWQNLVRPEIEALQNWHRQVEEQRQAVLERYRQEFLLRERLPIFEEAMIRLIELLELPGIGRWLSMTLNVLRLPWRALKAAWNAMSQGTVASGPLQNERDLLYVATQTALTQLWREAQHRQEKSVLYRHLSQLLDPNSPWQKQVMQALQEQFARYEPARRELVETVACNIYRNIEANPLVLNSLRGAKLSAELASAAGILLTGGINVWDLVLVPLATSVIQALTELLGSQYVEIQREAARQAQGALVAQQLVNPVWERIGINPVAVEWQRLQQTFQEMLNLRSRIAEYWRALQHG